MSSRAYRVGDVVCVKPDSVEALQREGYRDVKPHVPAKIVDDWASSISRRVLSLDMDANHVSGARGVSVYPSQVWLADGAAERYSSRREARVAEMVVEKAKREAARRRPKRKAKT